MATERRTIFRASALRHHTEDIRRSVVPRAAAPAVTACLWVLGGLLLAALGLAFLAPIPVSVSGAAAIVTRDNQTAAIVLVAAAPRPRLHMGQPATIRLAHLRQRQRGTIAAIEATPLSPAAARLRFAQFDPASITGPVTVVWVHLDADTPLGNDGLDDGGLGTASIVVGQRPIVALLPSIGLPWQERDG